MNVEKMADGQGGKKVGTNECVYFVLHSRPDSDIIRTYRVSKGRH